jgi:hypothetical protein
MRSSFKTLSRNFHVQTRLGNYKNKVRLNLAKKGVPGVK